MIIGCALFMELLDSTAVLTALARMAEDFGQPSIRMSLIVTLYLLAVAMFIPVSGWLAERFGPRRIFIAAIALFMCSSLACALSQTLWQLSLARFAQGAAGALMVPVGQVLLLRWAPREHLLSAMAYLTLPALLGPVVGPPLGGLLVTSLSWHWIFFINLPIGLIGILLVLRYIPDYPPSLKGRLDLRGFLLSSIGLACLVLAFSSVGHGTLSWLQAGGLLLPGLACCLLYVRHARRLENPLIDLSLLRIPSFACVLWGGLVFRLGSAATPFLLVLLFQVGFGLSALDAGLLTFAAGAGAFLIKLVAVPLVRRYGFRRILLVNAWLSALSIAACSLLQLEQGYALIVIVLFAGGLSRSLQMSTMGSLAYADVPADRVSRASTLSAMAVQLGMSLAVGLAAMLLGVIQQARQHSELSADDIGLALLFAALLCGVSARLFAGLAEDSGNGISR